MSLKFYRDLLGLKLAGEKTTAQSKNINNVFGARLQIAAESTWDPELSFSNI